MELLFLEVGMSNDSCSVSGWSTIDHTRFPWWNDCKESDRIEKYLSCFSDKWSVFEKILGKSCIIFELNHSENFIENFYKAIVLTIGKMIKNYCFHELHCSFNSKHTDFEETLVLLNHFEIKIFWENRRWAVFLKKDVDLTYSDREVLGSNLIQEEMS